MGAVRLHYVIGGRGYAWRQGVLAAKAGAVRVVKVPTGHFIPEEDAPFLTRQRKDFLK